MKKSILFIAAMLLFTCANPARAAENEFSKIWLSTTSEILTTYLEFDNKAKADDVLDNYIDGVVAGIFAMNHYNAGSEHAAALVACIGESSYSPSYLRKRMLAAGRDPSLGTVGVGTYLYAAVHLECTEVLGEYETADKAETTS
jgi:hypothetical protein